MCVCENNGHNLITILTSTQVEPNFFTDIYTRDFRPTNGGKHMEEFPADNCFVEFRVNKDELCT